MSIEKRPSEIILSSPEKGIKPTAAKLLKAFLGEEDITITSAQQMLEAIEDNPQYIDKDLSDISELQQIIADGNN